MHKIPKVIIVFLVVFTLIGCDQTTKSIAKNKLQFSSSIEYFGGLIQFVFAENEGGFLSIGSELPFVFRKSISIILALITVTGFIFLLLSAHKIKTAGLISLSLIVSGAFGNLIDRIFNHGRVIDFVILGTNGIHTGVFNLADVFIMAGITIFILLQFTKTKSAA